ncbi:hypothetical protein OG393_17010 [Streptomyces sp. NBC_01216]|uniref:hypothetical protein n=1 Tax=Streptomyces sp. NBC_01216 TaxID=2903778 RepID=UPI002E0DF6DB|nr:hypothetical protein OG393_17010 [Streptomyces sp. NBC_01216]
MTTVQTPPRPAPATTECGTEPDTVDTAGPQVGDDMTVEVALAVMASARTRLLLVTDNDGQLTGRVTLGRLTGVRDSPVYTDRLQLRDLPGHGGPLTSLTALASEYGVCHRGPAAPPLVSEHGGALDLPPLALA